jgi:hypothetical protein
MTLTQFVTKYNGKHIDFDGYPPSNPYQCVDLYRFYCKEVLGFNQSAGVASAYQLWDKYLKDYFTQVPNTPTGIPQPGDIIIWNQNYGPHGHVAIFLSGDVNKMTCFSQNDPLGQPCIKKDYTYRNIYGWLRPKENMSTALDTCQKDREKFWNERDNILRLLDLEPANIAGDVVEAAKRVIAGYKSRITDLGNQLGTLQAEVTNRIEQVSRLKAQLSDTQNSLKDVSTKLNEYIGEYEDLAVAKGKVQIELQQALNAIDTLKQAQEQGSVTLTIKDIFKLIWNQKITIKK